jgi:hypothetical protein
MLVPEIAGEHRHDDADDVRDGLGVPGLVLRMILSENRFTLFGIMRTAAASTTVRLR